MSGIDRRSLLKVAGGLLAVGFAGCKLERPRRPVLSRVRGGPLTGEVDSVRSVCMQCPAACGIEVERVDGVPVKIRGNPDYPTNRGSLCPKGLAGLQVLYDPDRVKGPLERVGPRGAGRWRPIAWDVAIGRVVERLQSIRKDPGPQAVAFFTGRVQGGMEPLVANFMKAYGSPNAFGNGSVGSDGTKVALEMCQGTRDYPGFDWENTNYVISFGANWLEAYRPTTYLLRAFAHLRRGRPGMRAKFVSVDTRFSLTAAKADEWIPIRPGTDAALALGMAHVIVKEKAFDAEFVAQHASGFEDWEDARGKHVGFRRYVLESWPPEKVEAVTGVEAERVVRLAREFASRRPSFAVGERGTSMQSNGLSTRTAVHALNALVGSINREGGVLVQREAPLRPLPEPRVDEVARKGLATPRLDGAGTRRFPLAREVSQAFPDAVLKEGARVEAAFLYVTNPLFSRANADEFRKALDRVPFLVSFSPFLDDTSRVCDLVLPDHTYLERWQEVPILPSVGFPVVGVRRPVTEPLYDTRHTGDVLLGVARGLAGSVAESLPWKDYRALMEHRLGGLAAVKGGSVEAGSESSFLTKVEEAGGWWDSRERFLPWDQVFQTPSKRYEFYATAMSDRLASLASPGESTDALLEELGIAARGDEAFLPHYEPPRFHGDPKAFPLHLNTYKPMTRAEGRGANLPWLQEIAGAHVHAKWSTWLEMNPDTASALGIGDGDEVVVESPRGTSVRLRARLWPGTRPDVVSMPFEQGHKGYGRWAERIGVNPNDLLVRDDERLTGMAATFGTRVKVRRA